MLVHLTGTLRDGGHTPARQQELKTRIEALEADIYAFLMPVHPSPVASSPAADAYHDALPGRDAPQNMAADPSAAQPPAQALSAAPAVHVGSLKRGRDVSSVDVDDAGVSGSVSPSYRHLVVHGLDAESAHYVSGRCVAVGDAVLVGFPAGYCDELHVMDTEATVRPFSVEEMLKRHHFLWDEYEFPYTITGNVDISAALGRVEAITLSKDNTRCGDLLSIRLATNKQGNDLLVTNVYVDCVMEG